MLSMNYTLDSGTVDFNVKQPDSMAKHLELTINTFLEQGTQPQLT